MATVVKRKRTYNAALRQEQAQMTRTRILDAARRLLTAGTYSSVTMEEIARDAGVSSQTVYAVFGNKLRLAQEIIQVGFHFEGLDELDARLVDASDPEVLLRGSAEISRRIYETCADLLRFLRESGDPKLLARYNANQDLRLTRETFLPAALEKSGRLRAGLSPAEVLAVIWAMTASDMYSMLVFERGWTPAQYENWLGMALTSLLLTPRASEPTRRSRD
jgi:AcrR family transcriptional regulator